MSRNRVINLANFQSFQSINVLSDPGAIGGPVVIPNGVRVIVRWNLSDGKVGRNILGALVPSAFSPTPALAEAFRAALVAGSNWTALAAFLSTTINLAGVDLLDIRTANQSLVSSTGAVTPGTSASTALPSETAIVLTMRTAKTGPGGRGRMYVPGWATNALAAGDVLAPAAMTALFGFCTNIANAFTALGAQHALALPARQAYIGATGTSHPARSAVMQPVTSIGPRDNHWDTQRRRGLK